MDTKLLASALFLSSLVPALPLAAQTIDLPTSKQLIEEVPGHPQRLNTLPVSIAISPDKRYVVALNAGFGTFTSHYEQSLAVYDTQSGTVTDFPDSRTMQPTAKQTLYSGLAFSRDGQHLYASMASVTNPTADGPDATGNGVAVYSFKSGQIAPERFIALPLPQLATGQTTRAIGEVEGTKGLPYPAAIAVIGASGAEKLLVAENMADDVVLLDGASGSVERRFDLSAADTVPSTFPVALAVSPDASRAWVALWNASEIVELNLTSGTIGRRLKLLKPSSPTAPGTHPCAFEVAPDGKTLYVALSNRDVVASVNVAAGQFAVRGYFDTRLPGQSYFGAEPVGLATNADGSRLYVANMASDAVAVMDTAKLTPKAAKHGMVEPIGFVPTEWMPMAVAFLPSSSGGTLFVTTGKGKGTGPNNVPLEEQKRTKRTTYIPTFLYGSIAAIPAADIDKHLAEWTQTTLESNRMKAAAEKITFANGSADRIKHVIYIIKENRTYDQIFGDLKLDGKPVGNGDPSLTMFGAETTPNLHKLALQFGVLDNFYDSGEVSGDGHVWSNAAIGTDYLEKAWEQGYRGNQHSYDFEGVVAEGYPLLQKIPDVNEPASGYLWGDLAAHHKTYYHFGEFISSIFCNEPRAKHLPTNPQQGPMLPGQACDHPTIAPGEALPAEWGGGVNKWPWPIPRLAVDIATKSELVGHFAEEAPDFDLAVPDQIRVEVFKRHLDKWIDDRQKGNDTMPNFVLLRLPNDHTAGTRPGGPTPRASVADNDLAVGRAIDAISHSAYWDDTAFFILEDDAQAGADHVDAHRSIAVVVSKYAPHAASGAYVDSRFYSTVSVLRTMETLLSLPPMNNNDALSSLISTLFTGPGDQPAFSADYSNRDNNLIYTANKKDAPGAEDSMKMDFRHADRADTQKLNVILWKDAKGSAPVPAMLKVKHKKPVKDADDD